MGPTQHAFHFPDGTSSQYVDMSHCSAQLNVGEIVVFEGDPAPYRVTAIQNQFRREPDEGAGEPLKMIIRNVILGYCRDEVSQGKN